MDDADRAQRIEEAHLAAALAGRPRPASRVVLSDACLACGDPIPPERRAALPGACLCFACQDDAERAMGR